MVHRFQRPQDFLFGAASVLNLSGHGPQPSYLRQTPEEAMARDFARVGSDLYWAVEQQPVQPPDGVVAHQLEFAEFGA